MKSHYSRSHHNKRHKHLSPLLSVAYMHELYLQKYEAAGTNIVSYGYYLKYFNENFNLSFGYPKSDTCCTCDGIQIQLEAADDTQKVGIIAQKEDHLWRVKNVYSSLRSNTNVAKTNAHIAIVTFDFQQNLPLPHVPVGEVFYMHQLWLYVFGVHNNKLFYYVYCSLPKEYSWAEHLTSLPKRGWVLFRQFSAFNHKRAPMSCLTRSSRSK